MTAQGRGKAVRATGTGPVQRTISVMALSYFHQMGRDHPRPVPAPQPRISKNRNPARYGFVPGKVAGKVWMGQR